MFILINQVTDNSERFETKDDLLNRLDNASERCKNLDIRETYSIRQVDENGLIKEKTTLVLPLTVSADEFLIDFGNSKPKNKRFSFSHGKRLGPVFKQKEIKTTSTSQTKEEVERSSKSDQTGPITKELKKSPSAKANTLKGYFLIGSVILLGLFQAYSMVQNQNIKTQVSQIITQQETLQTQVDFQKQIPNIDTFSRYFIPSYFSGNKEVVKPYYSKKLSANDLVREARKLQSVILKDVKQNGRKVSVTYVLVVMDGDNKQSVNLSFDIERANNGQYDYQVVSEPKEQ
ncbi:hypothetical protein V2H32_10475 [Streptococcus uberis]|uniref:hypothetical protein n=1 Tax=Streptococcus TaxID=1301 RepID=UPI001F4D8C0E|nr:hypothetical protein [Streptococcus agalactiae]MCH9591295.1 hypothetical protein [Streptococcus agalactiae]MEE3699410.1 hypothetical protein [Streptococcus uberis]